MKNRFNTKKEAIEFLKSIAWLDEHSGGARFSNNSPLYCLRYGETSRPDYYPARYKDGWAVKAEYFYLFGTFNKPKSGRLSDEDFNELFLTEEE